MNTNIYDGNDKIAILLGCVDLPWFMHYWMSTQLNKNFTWPFLFTYNLSGGVTLGSPCIKYNTVIIIFYNLANLTFKGCKRSRGKVSF